MAPLEKSQLENKVDLKINVAGGGPSGQVGAIVHGVTRALIDKRAIRCACLGTALKLPMTKATFIENSIMIIMATYMVFSL